jgi:hypothetical protein
MKSLIVSYVQLSVDHILNVEFSLLFDHLLIPLGQLHEPVRERKRVTDPVLAILRGHEVISANYKSLVRIVQSGVFLGTDNAEPLIFLEPSLLRVDAMTHVVLSDGEHACHVVADVALGRDKIHVQREHGLTFHEVLDTLQRGLLVE